MCCVGDYAYLIKLEDIKEQGDPAKGKMLKDYIIFFVSHETKKCGMRYEETKRPSKLDSNKAVPMFPWRA